MSVKPILFNTDMVKAILDGRKTVTRRVIKFKHPEAVGVSRLEDGSTGIRIGWAEVDENGAALVDLKTPYNTGDFLYVRETWAKLPGASSKGGYAYKYKASQEGEYWSKVNGFKWKPSIHMPKEAARIWLRVTNIRVDRLGYTTSEDWEKEGIPKLYPPKEMWIKF